MIHDITRWFFGPTSYPTQNRTSFNRIIAIALGALALIAAQETEWHTNPAFAGTVAGVVVAGISLMWLFKRCFSNRNGFGRHQQVYSGPPVVNIHDPSYQNYGTYYPPHSASYGGGGNLPYVNQASSSATRDDRPMFPVATHRGGGSGYPASTTNFQQPSSVSPYWGAGSFPDVYRASEEYGGGESGYSASSYTSERPLFSVADRRDGD